MKKSLIVLLTIATLCPGAVFGQVTNLIPATTDAWVFRGGSSTDEDESQALQTKQVNNGNARIAYVRFNLASFLSNYSVANITSVRLKMYSQGSGTADSLEVYGLNNTNVNGVPDSAWTSNMTWNTQPAKTASPNDIPSSTSAFPNANTTPQLCFWGFSTAPQEVDAVLTAAQFQQFLLADTNQQVTLLFYNANANIINWASISNTNGYLVPTLELAATASAGPPRALTWAGAPSGTWDAGTNANWKTNLATANTVFNQGDSVTFDNSLTGTSTITLAQEVMPGSITVSNSAVNYTFNGPGYIGGITGLTKEGTGTLTINTGNNFSGPVVVMGGTLQAGNNNALGAGSGGTTITNGATLDLNGKSLTSEPVFIAGAGVSGNGVVINSGAQQIDGLQNVTLLDDVTFGGTGRWDIRGGATLSSQGLPRKITKIGSNQIGLVGVQVDPALGDINVQSGILSVETSTSGLGNPTNTLSVASGATLQFYEPVNCFIKNVVFNSGSTLLNYAGLNRFGGPITLVGSVTINAGSGSSLELTNTISGVGGPMMTGSGTLIMDGTNTYFGPTTINSGKFVINGQLTGGGSLTMASGTILAPKGGTSGPSSISGALYPGDLTGIGTFNSGNLTMASGATATFEIRASANDLVQVNGNLVLNNNTITVVPLENLQTNVPYTLVTYTGTLSGTFNPVLNLDSNFTATLDYSTPGQVNLIFSRIMTFTIPTAYPTGPGPMNVTLGADGKLIYWPDTNGDTVPDFSQAGYMGGGVPIPTNVPVFTTLSPIAGDNSPQIQAAINNLAAQPLNTNGFRGVIYLNPGIYYMSNGLNCSASGIVLRGAGCDTNGTIMRLYQSQIIWTVSNPSGVGRSEVSNTRHNITSQYVPLGANWFQVDSVANWSVGDDIVIYRPSTALWIQTINTAVQYPLSWTAGEVDLPVERKIVTIEGNRIRIDAPIFCAIDQLYGGGYVYKYTYSGRVQNVGLEGIRADCMSGVDSNGNTAGELVTFDGVMNCWVRNCMNDKMGGHTIKASGSKWCTFEDIISFHNPLPAGHSGPSIQINTHDTSEGLLFHRFTTSDGGFEFSSGSQSPGPNVISECDIPHAFASTSPHMKWTVGTLYDAMFMHQGLVCLDAGGSHGWCGANHLIWNTECSGVGYDRPFTAHQGGIGVVSENATWDPNRTGTLPPEMISWQTHVDPRSLYRAQLAERVGAQNALNALGQPYGDNYFLVTAPTNAASAAPGQTASAPVVLTTAASYPDATFIPNPAGSVAVNSWPNSNVVFSVSGLPWGCSANFNSSSLNAAGTNTVNLVASNNAPVGSYWVLAQGSSSFPDIRGNISPLTQTAPILFTITGPNNFLLSASPAGQSVLVNSTTNFTIQVTASNGFNDSVALSITNLPPGVSASFNPPTVTGAGSSTLTLTISNSASAGNFTMTILGSDSGLVSGATASLNIISTALPSPWADTDVGSQTNTGSASYFNGVFTGVGGGSDVWGASDQFNYIFQPQSGDFAITARVAGQTAADPWSKAGVMIRETTNSNSTYVFAMVSPTASHGASLQYRTATGGSAADAADISGPTVPYWVRLVRSGSNFTGFMSSDGVTWTQITNAIPITMSSNVMVGLAVCAHNSSALSTATFDNVSINYPYFTLSLSPAIQGVNGNSNASYTVSLQNYFGFSGNVALSAFSIPPYSTAAFSAASISGTNISTLTITTTNITPPDSYDLDIMGTNGTLADEEFVELDVTNTVDTDADGIPDWWMQQYFGHATGSAADNTLAQDDFDGDGMSNLAEFLCGTDPTDPTSYLHMLSVLPQGNDEAVSWSAIGGINYVVQSGTNLSAGFTDISPEITPDNDGTETYLDAGAATNSVLKFYRVRLGP